MQIRQLFTLHSWTAHLLLVSGLSLTAMLAFAQPSASSKYNFVTLDYPNAPITYPLGINNKGDIAGSYYDATFTPHGFVYRKGKFVAIDFPGAAITTAGGLNDRGDVSGTYFDFMGFQHGYLMTVPEDCEEDDGNSSRCAPTFQSIDFPGAAQTQGISFEFGPGLGTGVAGLNNHDEVAGMYATSDLYSNGMIYSKHRYLFVDAPDASHTAGNGTRLFGINNRGHIVGDYIVQADPAQAPLDYGFLLKGDRYTPIFVPNSDQGGFGTQVNGINDFNVLVGTFSDPMGNGHGFLWVEGKYFMLDYPAALFTEVHTLNNSGAIVGSYIGDPAGYPIHGFIARPKL